MTDAFRRKIEACFSTIGERLAGCLEEAKLAGKLPAGTDTPQIANLIVDCWEGAALRSRLRRNPASLRAMLDFRLRSIHLPDERDAARPRAGRTPE